MRRILWVTLATAVMARAESAVSLFVGTPQIVDLQYELRSGAHGFAFRSGLVFTGIENSYSVFRSFRFLPEIAYGHVLHFGEQSWLKPALGLGYRHGWWENLDGQENEGEPAIREGGIFLVPRLEMGKRFGWIKLACEYGMMTSLTWSNDRGGSRPVRGKQYYTYFPLDHAVGVTLGVYLNR